MSITDHHAARREADERFAPYVLLGRASTLLEMVAEELPSEPNTQRRTLPAYQVTLIESDVNLIRQWLADYEARRANEAKPIDGATPFIELGEEPY